MLRAVITAAELVAPATKSETMLGMEQLGAKVLAELTRTSTSARALNVNVAHGGDALKSLNINLTPAIETVPGSESERALAKYLVEDQANLELVGKMQRGTHGAWLARSLDGKNHIFKLVSPEDVTAQIRTSADSAAAVNSLLTRTPRYDTVAFTPHKGSWYVQEFLSGTPAAAPTERLINGMVQLNDLQAGRGISNGKNWSGDVMDALYKDSKGWQKHIAESGQEGKTFVNDVRSMVEKNRFLKPTESDVVHGDFQHYNALVNERGRLSGYIDWEGAGKGDRGIDLSRLLYDSYVAEAEIGYKVKPETLQMLSNKIAAISGPAQRDNYMSYWALQVADYGLYKSPADGSMFMGVGRRILEDLKASRKVMGLAA